MCDKNIQHLEYNSKFYCGNKDIAMIWISNSLGQTSVEKRNWLSDWCTQKAILFDDVQCLGCKAVSIL